MIKNKAGITITIDTSQTKEVIVGIRLADGKRFVRRESITAQKAQRVLPLLHMLLDEHALSWDQITAIEVHPGPGSYTGLRVGFAVANTLGYTLGISVNDLAPGSQAYPRY